MESENRSRRVRLISVILTLADILVIWPKKMICKYMHIYMNLLVSFLFY